MTIIQGDAYSVPFKITDGETIVTPNIVDKVEIVIGDITKYYPDQITFDTENKTFMFPLSQEETFTFNNSVSTQVRVKYTNEDVKGCNVGFIAVKVSKSKEVL